ncbi:MAG: AIM24 family protein, partial [Vicinamibacteria bacterium]
MSCSQCGSQVAAGARFCGSCGAPAPSAGPSSSRPSEFHVIGDVMQAVVVPLKPGEEIQAEPGALLYMAGDVEMDSQMKGGLWGGLKRMVAGESLFMTKFRSRG